MSLASPPHEWHRVFSRSIASGFPNLIKVGSAACPTSEARGRELSGSELYWKYIRGMAYRDAEEMEINTHPVGYIGADNKGLDQLLAAPGGTNRDSHHLPGAGALQGYLTGRGFGRSCLRG